MVNRLGSKLRYCATCNQLTEHLRSTEDAMPYPRSWRWCSWCPSSLS
jgi:hypothetical protein